MFQKRSVSVYHKGNHYKTLNYPHTFTNTHILIVLFSVMRLIRYCDLCDLYWSVDTWKLQVSIK